MKFNFILLSRSFSFLLAFNVAVACGTGQSLESRLQSFQAVVGRPIGALCTAKDPNFDGFRYPSHVAHCARNVTSTLKAQVAKRYGIPFSDYHLYEFDHYIPLNAGGANSIDNIWPEIHSEAVKKDVLELQIYNDLVAGRINQPEAVDEVNSWMKMNTGLDPIPLQPNPLQPPPETKPLGQLNPDLNPNIQTATTH